MTFLKHEYKDYNLVIKRSEQLEKTTDNFLGKIIIDCKENDLVKIFNLKKAFIDIIGNTNCDYIENSFINSISGNVKIRTIFNNTFINKIYDNVKIDNISSTLINEIHDNVNIDKINGATKIDYIQGRKIIINNIFDETYIRQICGDGVTIENIYNNAIIGKVFGQVNIKNILDYAIVRVIDAGVKIENLLGNAKVVFNNIVEKNSDQEFKIKNYNKLKIEKDLDNQNYQIKRFLILNNLEVNKGKVILFKIIDNLIDNDLKIGEKLTYKNWDPNPKLFGGSGFVVYANPEIAYDYKEIDSGKILKCEVDLDDIVIYINNIIKVHCRELIIKRIEYSF